MIESDRPRFAQLLASLAEGLGEPLSPARVDAYWMALEEVPLDAVRLAIKTTLKQAKFWPKPSELLAAAGHVEVSPAWVNEQLSRYLSGHPVDEFVQLFVQRLGGTRAVEDRLPLDRLPYVERLYPGIIAACRAREIPIPTEAGLIGGQDVLALDQGGTLPALTYDDDPDE